MHVAGARVDQIRGRRGCCGHGRDAPARSGDTVSIDSGKFCSRRLRSELDLERMCAISPSGEIRPRQVSHHDSFVTQVSLFVKKRLVILGIHHLFTVNCLEDIKSVSEGSRGIDHVKKNRLQLRPLEMVHEVHYITTRKPVAPIIEKPLDAQLPVKDMAFGVNAVSIWQQKPAPGPKVWPMRGNTDPVELGGHQPIGRIEVHWHAIPDLEHRCPVDVFEGAGPAHIFH